ncbi:MAG: DNA adenine methylase [Legionellales bacterium]|nr:DNA adenine methylase [Legionellales bacterium]|tara:strand:+ start:16759 stop:17580 length:822 start_codon:yes stop_codon:yes gene_type:complete
MSKKYQRSFLKWAGSKYQLLKHILPILPDGKTLIEPFVGSGVVFLNTDYDNYILSDSNRDLINVYQFVQKEGFKFVDDANYLFKSEHNRKSAYYQFRDEFNASKKKRERALLFIYLNRHGYNGLCRYNSSGELNVPFGQHDKPSLNIDNIMRFHDKSQNALFTCEDFRDTLKRAKKHDVVYCDPPYVPLSDTAYFTSYNKHDFDVDDQLALAEHAQRLQKKGVHTLLSNHDTEFTQSAYHQADITSFDVQRMISCKVDNRAPVRELLALYSPR